MRYRILKPIALDFLTPREQQTTIFESGFIRVENGSIFYENAERNVETINCLWLVDHWMSNSMIEPA